MSNCCSHNCVNIDNSVYNTYECTHIYTTAEIICRVLTAPDNGDVDCSLGDDGEANPGDTCTFKCNTGFGIEDGSISRTCQIDGTWSGRRTECGRGECYYVLQMCILISHPMSNE